MRMVLFVIGYRIESDISILTRWISSHSDFGSMRHQSMTEKAEKMTNKCPQWLYTAQASLHFQSLVKFDEKWDLKAVYFVVLLAGILCIKHECNWKLRMFHFL